MEDESLITPTEVRPHYTRDQMLMRMDAKLDMLATQLAGKADAAVVESLSHRVGVGELWMAEMKGQQTYGQQLVEEFRTVQRALDNHLQTPHVYASDYRKERASSVSTVVLIIAAVISALGIMATIILALALAHKP